MNISPSYDDTKLDNPSFEDLVDVFEDRIRRWLLEPAKILANTENGQVAGFCLLLTYFEGISKFIEGRVGRAGSKERFVKRFLSMFEGTGIDEDLSRKIAEVVYKDARCEFFHNTLFGERIYFRSPSNGPFFVTFQIRDGKSGDIESIVVDSKQVSESVEYHFDNYIRSLRDPARTDEREAFARVFKETCDWERPGPVIGIDEPNSEPT